MMWRRILTFGAEGTEAGNFCRPWGVAIARYSELSTLSDTWPFNSSTSASSSDTFTEWFRPVGVGFSEDAYDKHFIGPGMCSNNNRSNSTHSTACSTYLIGVADRSNNRIQLFEFDAIRQTVTFLHMFGDGPGARHGQFDRPAGIVFNPKLEQIIVADKDNHRVQVFDMSGSYLFKFGERGSKCGQFCYPWDIDVCKITHNIIVSDTRNRRIQMFNNLGRYLTHFSQPLDSPRGIAYLSTTQIMVSDFNKHRLVLITQSDDKTVTSSTSLMSTNENNYLINPPQKSTNRQINQQFHESKFVGFGEGSSWGEFLRPQGTTVYGSAVYCSDSRNNRVAHWNRDTQTFGYINRDVVELDRPAGLAAIDNYIVIVDFGNNRVHICQHLVAINGSPFDSQMQSKSELSNWRRILTFGAEGTEAGNFCRPWGVAIARYSELSTLSDTWPFNSSTSASSSDTFTEWFRPVGVGFSEDAYDKHFIGPGMCSNNNRSNSTHSTACSTYLIGVADRSNNRIQLFEFDAIRQTVTFLHMFGDGPGARHGQFDRPAGIVFNPKLEQIIVADKDNHRVQVFDMSGSYLFKFGERGSKCGQFCYPWDIDVCKITHNIIVSDTRNRRIQMFNNLGRYLTHFSQPLDSPRGIAYLSTTQIMVSDFNKHRLVLITQSDDKTVTSSTSLMSTNENNYLINPPQKSTNRQINQQFHESKFVGFGEGSSWGEFLRPQGVSSSGSTVYCSDSRNNRLVCWSKDTQNFSYISRDVVELDRPAGVATIDNYIVIVDFGNNRVHICQRQAFS